MTTYSNNYNKNTNSLINDEFFLSKKENKETSCEMLRSHLHLKNFFYEKDIKKSIKTDFEILNFITDINERRSSAKTNFTNQFSDKVNYELSMVNKYDEKLNDSLSYISDFDLEEDEKINDSFNSSDDENYVEEIEIKTKTNKIVYDKAENKEIESELEKEWFDIKQLLLFKKKDSSK